MFTRRFSFFISTFLCYIKFTLFGISLNSCAVQPKGAGSGSIPISSSVSVSVPATNLILSSAHLEGAKNFVFGIGAWNLKPFLIGGYFWEDSILGLGISGIPFSGLKVEYTSVGGDISYMKVKMRGESSFLGFGGGLSGMYSTDYNFSEEGKRHTFAGGNFYFMAHLYTQAEGSNVGFLINLRAGYYHYYSTFLKKVAEEKKKTGDPYIRVRNNFGGLFFTPAVGFAVKLVGGKVGLIFDLNLPLSAALIFEPDLHPYVPSFDFALVF